MAEPITILLEWIWIWPQVVALWLRVVDCYIKHEFVRLFKKSDNSSSSILIFPPTIWKNLMCSHHVVRRDLLSVSSHRFIRAHCAQKAQFLFCIGVVAYPWCTGTWSCGITSVVHLRWCKATEGAMHTCTIVTVQQVQVIRPLPSL